MSPTVRSKIDIWVLSILYHWALKQTENIKHEYEGNKIIYMIAFSDFHTWVFFLFKNQNIFSVKKSLSAIF